MITLFSKSNTERAKSQQIQNQGGIAETAGSLAMLFHSGLLTMGQYDEFVSSNPFAVDYSMYVSSDSGDSVAYSGFLDGFASAMSALGDAGGGFASYSGGGMSCGTSCGGGFTSFC